ncbi:MAG: CPBP family intramembrane metalloprotease [Deltaproteobacteria bacterium]|nr:CPBP family intramembrane metalloprotease [Deltaproteobacteria bacterium]
MKSYQRLFLFALAVLAMTALLSPWAAMTWEQITSMVPGWEQYRYSFGKIFNRFFMISGIVLFFFFRRFLRLGPMDRLGLSPRAFAWRDIGRGFGLAVGSMAGLALIMSWLDVFEPFFRLSLAESLKRCASAMLAAATVGFLEEILFRGVIFKGLFEELGRARAYLIAALFYSAIHFVKPGDAAALGPLDAWIGIRYLAGSFHPFTDLTTLFPGLLGLFLIGAVLCYAFERTGTLYLSIGLHAGWIFSLKTLRVFGDFRRGDLGWMFGSTDPKIVSGVITWLGILLVAVAVSRLTRRRARLFPDPPVRATA